MKYRANHSASRRHKATVVISLLLVVAILMTGTFAWTYYRDHKTNDAEVDALLYKARLVEEYDSSDTKNWRTTDEAVTKTISVVNPGAETEWDINVYGDIFTRIQLKEFMEFYLTKDVYTADRYMIDTEGNFISFATKAEGLSHSEMTANTYGNGDHEVVQLRMVSTPLRTNSYSANKESIDMYIKQYNKIPGMTPITVADLLVGGTGDVFDTNKVLVADNGLDDADLPWYIQTKESDPNGVYGSFMLIGVGVERDYPKSLVTGVENQKDSQSTHHNDLINTAAGDEDINYSLSTENGECTYTTHTWGEGLNVFTNADWSMGGENFDKYINWNYGPDVMTFTDWIIKGRPMDVWVVDDRVEGGNVVSEQGWVYWVGHLEPSQYTTNFLESIELVAQPKDTFYYAIHTDMQSVSFDDLYRWDDMPDEIYQALVSSYVKISRVTVDPSTAYVVQGKSQNFEARVFGNVESVPQDVVWSIDDIFTGSRIDQNGKLTVSANHPRNSQILVTATSKFDDTVYGYAVVTVTGDEKIDVIELTPDEEVITRMVIDGEGENTMQLAVTFYDQETGEPISIQDATWTVRQFQGTTAPAVGTTISSTGLLTVGATEANGALIVRATSVYDSTKYAEATVYVVQVTGITVTSPYSSSTNYIDKGVTNFDAGLVATQTCTPSGATAPGGVLWSIDGNPTGFEIDAATGFLTVPEDTTVKQITVRATSKYDQSVSKAVTIYIDPTEITGFTAQTEFCTDPDHQTPDRTYLVASSSQATTFTLNTTTTGTPADKINKVPEVSFEGGTLNADCSEDKVVIEIPANYTGEVEVTLSAAGDSSKAVTFTLDIAPIGATIEKVSIPGGEWAGGEHNAVFVAGDWEWRVLTKGLDGGGGNDALILSMHVFAGSWHSANNTTTAYQTSEMRNSLKGFYDSDSRFTWAHDYAIEPEKTNWNVTAANYGPSTTSSGNRTADSTDYDGAFLLSRNDYCTASYGFSANGFNSSALTMGSGINQPSRKFTKTDGTRYGSGSATNYNADQGTHWTRSMYSTNTPWTMNPGGGWGSTTNMKNRSFSYQPAMIIRWK